MSDFSLPVLTSLYQEVIDTLKARDADAATLFLNDPTNQPVGSIRLNRTTKVFQEWSGAAWVDIIIGVPGGGTGGSTPGTGGLGLGTMSIQNAVSVAITGGAVTGLSSFSLSTGIIFDADGTRNIGSANIRPGNVYVRNGLVIPVGVDKWVTA
jgi:hypothetical protein